MNKDKTLQLTLTYPQYAEMLIYCMNHEDEPELQRFSKILQNKLDKLVEHDLYTKYKTAPSEEQKEQARQEYLERRGIPTSFRW